MRILALALLIFSGAIAGAQETEPVNILVLHSYDFDLPWTQGLQEGFRRAQRERPELRLFVEYFGASRARYSMANDEWARHLERKYRQTEFSGVIADSDRAVRLLVEYPQLFGDIPTVLFSESVTSNAANQVVVRSAIEARVKGTVALALEQNPTARRATIIEGTGSIYDQLIGILEPALEENGLALETVGGVSIESLQTMLRDADDTGIAFYFPVFADSTGRQFIPRDVISLLGQESAVPVYTFWSTFVGTGVVGGVMTDPVKTAATMIGQIISYRNTGSFLDDYSTDQTYVDWEAMERYDINQSAIPPGATVINRPRPFIVRHYTEVIAVAAVVSVLGLLLITDLLLRNRSINKRLRIQGQALEEALGEQQTLYREMNHRARNNLNVLANLVALQLDEIDDPAVRRPLEDVAGRLTTLALVQDALYKESAGRESHAKTYLESLAEQIFSSMTPGDGAHYLHLSIDDVELEPEKAVSCGLIVNELLTNAMKYAFPDGRQGKVFVDLSRTASGDLELSVRDTGVGLPPDFDLDSAGGLGVKIVRALADQLGGTFTLERDGGTGFAVRFPG